MKIFFFNNIKIKKLKTDNINQVIGILYIILRIEICSKIMNRQPFRMNLVTLVPSITEFRLHVKEKRNFFLKKSTFKLRKYSSLYLSIRNLL